MDDDNDRRINFSEFVKALNDYRLGFSADQARELFAMCQQDKGQRISIDEFTKLYTGEMN